MRRASAPSPRAFIVFFVSLRRLVLVTGLTLGDYFLWSYSLDSGRDVLAIVSGLSLPPLAAAWLWLVGLEIARTVARGSRVAPPSARSSRTSRAATEVDATRARAATVHAVTPPAGSAPRDKLAA
jgi:hypothetical protein